MKYRWMMTVALVAPLVFFSGCGEEEEPTPPPIVGTWTRAEYQLEVPSGFSEYTQPFSSFGETGYTITIKSDGTYSRAYTPIVNDEGNWTLDGASLVLKPNDADDLDAIEDDGFVGLEFTVEGEVSDIRMVLSRVVRLALYSDAYLATLKETDPLDPSKRTVLDVKILYKFNRLK